MTKTQKIIILAAAVLIILSLLYPPYYAINRLSDDLKGLIVKSGWGWISMINRIDKYPFEATGNMVITNYKIRFDVLSLEIFGILVLAGAAHLTTKKR
jgi:hypothetical protein